MDLPPDLIVIDMQDEHEGVITFLDECVRKCLKTPHKYVEVLRTLAASSAEYNCLGYSDRLNEYPSPLLMTLFEHLESSIKNRSLPAAHIIGITAFIGRLIFCLLGKTSLGLLQGLVDKVEDVLTQNPMLDEDQNRAEAIAGALKRELKIMRRALTFTVTSDAEMAVESEEAHHWLVALEDLPIRRFLRFFLFEKNSS